MRSQEFAELKPGLNTFATKDMVFKNTPWGQAVLVKLSIWLTGLLEFKSDAAMAVTIMLMQYQLVNNNPE